MPVPTAYPGVYVEEIPSVVRTIAAVATSITAFIGRTPNGPVTEPVTDNSFKEFEQNGWRAGGTRQKTFPLCPFSFLNRCACP
jgi:hypothetical protein